MGWGDSVGTEGPGGGYGGGHSSTGGGRGGGRDTPGSPNAPDGRRGSSMGPRGGTNMGSGARGGSAASDTPGSPNAPDGRRGSSMGAGGGTNTGTGVDSGTSRGDTRAGSRTVGAQESPSAPNAMESFDAIANGAIASFTDALDTDGSFGSFAEQADAQMGPENVGYGNTAYSGNSAVANASQAAAMTRGQHTQSLEQAGVPDAIQARAKPGLPGGLLSIAASLANPFAGLAVDTAARAYSASKEIGALNEAFGTSLDDSFGHSLGQQAVGTIGSFAGRRAGGLLGGRMGTAFGPVGAALGTMAGATVGKNFGRGLAMGSMDTSTPSTPGNEAGGPSSASPEGSGGQYGGGQYAGTQPSQNTPASPAAPPNFEVADFDGYASYAESFFV